MLRILGLSPVEQAVYEALIARPPASVAELGDLCAEHGWSNVDGVAALGRLQRLRLVTELPTDPPRYAPTPPQTALDALLGAHNHELARAHQHMQRLATRFHHSANNRADDRADGRADDAAVEVVRGRTAMAQAVADLNRSIRHEVLSFDAPPYFGDVREGNIVRRDEPLADVTFRVLFDPRALESPVRVTALATTDRPTGHKARVTHVPVKLFLIDSRIGLLPIDQVTFPFEAFVLVHDPHLLAVLRALFEVYWQHAVPVNIPAAGVEPEHPTPLTNSDRELLALLVSGFTDRAIATHFGWTERTVRNRVGVLLRRLGAETRFQAGYQAVVRGWLSTSDTSRTETESQ